MFIEDRNIIVKMNLIENLPAKPSNSGGDGMGDSSSCWWYDSISLSIRVNPGFLGCNGNVNSDSSTSSRASLVLRRISYCDLQDRSFGKNTNIRDTAEALHDCRVPRTRMKGYIRQN